MSAEIILEALAIAKREMPGLGQVERSGWTKKQLL